MQRDSVLDSFDISFPNLAQFTYLHNCWNPDYVPTYFWVNETWLVVATYYI